MMFHSYICKGVLELRNGCCNSVVHRWAQPVTTCMIMSPSQLVYWFTFFASGVASSDQGTVTTHPKIEICHLEAMLVLADCLRELAVVLVAHRKHQ